MLSCTLHHTIIALHHAHPTCILPHALLSPAIRRRAPCRELLRVEHHVLLLLLLLLAGRLLVGVGSAIRVK